MASLGEPTLEEDVTTLTDPQLAESLRDIKALISPDTAGYHDATMTHLSLGDDCPVTALSVTSLSLSLSLCAAPRIAE